MSNLKALPWIETSADGFVEHTAQGAGIFYRIFRSNEDIKVIWVDSMGGSDGNKFFKFLDEAKHWIETDHYPHKMQPYVVPDSITDIRNWFKAAKPEPTFNDYITQLGCHIEEIAEMALAIGAEESPFYDEASIQAEYLKGLVIPSEYIEIQKNLIDDTELLDALCDQIVTATGVAYMMGFDIEGALKEVIRSNNSKMVKGKFEYDENGKIAKPESYSKPDLTPFVSNMQNLHKGE